MRVKGRERERAVCEHRVMARPKNQTQRRDQLISAAAQAVLQRGASGARLADVAQEAGLTAASVLYYYPDVRELFTAVFEQGSIEYCIGREAQVARASTPVEKLYACIRSGIPRAGTTEDASRILYELMPVVLRNDLAAAQHRLFIARQTSLYQGILEEGEASGDFTLRGPAAVLARSLVALEDGYGIDVLIGAMTADQEEEVLLLHARGMAGIAG
jgi:AcrR family transcriptional regulator